jgi:hypothetical protein
LIEWEEEHALLWKAHRSFSPAAAATIQSNSWLSKEKSACLPRTAAWRES